jgi:hypothetical protein
MTKSKLVVAFVAVLLVVLFVAAWAPGSGASAPKAGGGRLVTIHVTAHQTSVKPGTSVTTITNDLISNGQTIGSQQIACVSTGPGSLAVCTAASVLPKGQLLSEASLTIPPGPGTTVTAITGGTGAYGLARGTIDSVRTSGSTDADTTYHVVVS